MFRVLALSHQQSARCFSCQSFQKAFPKRQVVTLVTPLVTPFKLLFLACLSHVLYLYIVTSLDTGTFLHDSNRHTKSLRSHVSEVSLAVNFSVLWSDRKFQGPALLHRASEGLKNWGEWVIKSLPGLSNWFRWTSRRVPDPKMSGQSKNQHLRLIFEALKVQTSKHGENGEPLFQNGMTRYDHLWCCLIIPFCSKAWHVSTGTAKHCKTCRIPARSLPMRTDRMLDLSKEATL